MVPEAFDDAAAAVGRALTQLGDALAGAAPAWLALGVLLHLANQAARGCGWHAIVRSACGHGGQPRRRDVIAAWVAGAAAGGVLSARGGDAVRVVLLRRRVQDAGCPLLAGTLVAEGVGELAVGAVLVAVALAVGVGPEISAPPLAVMLAAPPILAAAVAAAWRVGRVRRVARHVARGCTPLRAPGAYARTVVPWQTASRACRLGALACFLVAFGLPAAPAAILLVVFAQTGGRLLPFGPASVGAGVAMLAASFETVTGSAVTVGQVAAFFVGMSTILTLAGLAVAVPLCLRTVRWSEVAETVRTARDGGALQAATGDGRILGAPLGRRVPARATSVPAP